MQREVEVLRKAKEELEKHVDELVGKIAEFEEKVKKAKSLQSQEVKVYYEVSFYYGHFCFVGLFHCLYLSK